MKAGMLNRMVTIQAPPTGQDAAGQPSGDWTEVVSVWANIRQPGGLESVRAASDTSVVRASIRIRYRTDVTNAMRVVHAGTVYQIKAVLHDLASKQHTDLVCEVVS